MMGGMKGEIHKEDYCFDCKRWIDTDEIGHQEHEKLSTRINKPPDERSSNDK